MTGDKQQQKKQQPEASKNVLRQVIAVAFIVQAALIGVQGNLDVFSGKPVLDVIQGMIAQGIELIIKAQRTQANLKETERKPR
jgi:hypothetical protein